MGSQLKIRGLYTRYFYICFACLLFSGFLFTFSITDLFKGAAGTSLYLEFLVEFAAPFILYRVFYCKSNQDKILKKSGKMTVCNRQLYKILNHKR